jgi:hypothetical protein
VKSLSLCGALVGLALMSGCSEPPPPAPPPVETPAPVRKGWKTRVAFEAGVEVRALAMGDVAAHPGKELVAVGAGVVVAWQAGQDWKIESVDAGPGPLRGVLIADVDPSLEGVEVVVVGETPDGRGRAELLSWTESSGWRVTRLCAPPRPLAAVGLIDGTLCVVGESAQVLRRHEGRWTAVELAKLPSPAQSLRGQGERLIVGCAHGELLELTLGLGGRPRVIDRRVAARNAIGIRRGHLVTADDDGTLSLLPKSGGEGLPERIARQDRVELHRSQRALTGALLADLDPDAEGLELAACGETGELVLLTADGEGRFQAETLLNEVSPLRALHHLGGRQLVTASEGGTVTLVSYR